MGFPIYNYTIFQFNCHNDMQIIWMFVILQVISPVILKNGGCSSWILDLPLHTVEWRCDGIRHSNAGHLSPRPRCPDTSRRNHGHSINGREKRRRTSSESNENYRKCNDERMAFNRNHCSLQKVLNHSVFSHVDDGMNTSSIKLLEAKSTFSIDFIRDRGQL